ncbi:DUF4255 domain-containing protein [Shimia sp. Alg240-R146]|uniref:DUF4255 domain-containing protein n=1 Tax=Shimia sp. Alg240-R146 TaxID=2993449 RepID=UPI0022E94702|nr:DUF4255 domain-containing protein [Shimia sp. Alg240-R146]
MIQTSIFDVTTALRNLVWFNIRRMYGFAENEIHVTLLPPEDVAADTVPTINLHLYHVSEDVHHRNAVGYDTVMPPISGQPMALRLFYILTPHQDANGLPNPQGKQEFLSAAMKTLHDFPVIDPGLSVQVVGGGPNLPVMPANLAASGHRIEIAMRNLEPEDNINFWSTEDQKTPRLSAYYEVRAAFLPPEMPTTTNGTVFDVGLYVSSASVAKLSNSRAVLRFDMPAETGMGAQALDVVPARAVLWAAPNPAQERVYLTGDNLTAGDLQRLTLSQNGQTHALDPALNPNWDAQFATNEISFIPQTVLTTSDGGVITAVPITAGRIELGLEIVAYRFQGTTRLESTYEAGKVAIQLGARIIDHTAPAADVYRVNLEAATDLTAADLLLALDGQYYIEDTVNLQPADPGTYVRQTDHIFVRPHLPAPLTGAHAFQLFVNGAESQPFWIEAGP